MSSLTIPILSGSDPELIDIADAKEAVGEDDGFGYVVDLCTKNKKSGHHEYNMADDFQRCIYCGRDSGI